MKRVAFAMTSLTAGTARALGIAVATGTGFKKTA
jgi:hypothetical protein